MSVVVVLPDWAPNWRTGADFVHQMVVRELATQTDVHVLAVRDRGRNTMLTHPAKSLSICSRQRMGLLEHVFGPLPTVALWSRGEAVQDQVRELVAVNQASHILVSPTYAAVNVPRDVDARLVVLTLNVEHRRIRGLESVGLNVARRAWLQVQALRMERLERGVLARAAAVLAVSAADTAMLGEMVRATTPVITVPVVPDQSLLSIPLEGRPDATMLFVGSLGYRPNVEAALTLARTVLPEVRRTHPHAKLLLAGSDPPRELQRLAVRHDVQLVPDFKAQADIFSRATVFVAPLGRQEGLSIKTLNALSSGTPIIATPAVLATLGAQPGTHALAADSTTDFVRAVVRLLDDPSLRRRLAGAGRAFVTLNFSEERLRTAIRTTLSAA